MKAFVLFSLVLLIPAGLLNAQYSNHERVVSRIKALGQDTTIARAASIAKTRGERDIYILTVGKGDFNNKPGIAVIGGINGASLASVEIVLQMAEKLVKSKSPILEDNTFYFLPDVSPDASEQYFAPVSYERNKNTVPVDDDKDGKYDEDGFDDLNKDGLISWMRILDDDKGEYMVHPENPNVMIKADVSKGQKGTYILLKEGLDNDKDGEINEDQPGGVVFNKNFSFNYPYFTDGAGDNSLSEAETRAVAKFLFDHWNIYAVLCFGPENNLSEFSDLKTDLIDKKIPAEISEKDKPYFQSTVELYKKYNRLNDSSRIVPTGGDILSWVYFHYNRFAFSTPGWNVRKNKNNMGSGEFDYLKFATEAGLKDQVIPWQKTEHPDFPGKTIEIGGIKPFLSINPPLSYIDSVSGRHLDFLMELAGRHPALKFSNIKVTRNSGDLYQVEADITNTGGFPTMTVLATGTRWVKKIRVDLMPSKSQEMAGGRKVFLYDRIIPGESVKQIWLVKGKGTIILKAGSPQTGTIIREVELN
jgi:hypothetical protein